MSSVINIDALFMQAEKLSRGKFRPGYDSMTAEGTLAWLQINGERLCRELLDGSYRPMPAVGFRTAKTRGGYRRLSRLTALDSVIQYVLLEAISPLCEERFSDSSFAYRTGHGVTAALTRYIALAGTYSYAAKLDFTACFDNMNHSVLEKALKTFVYDEKIDALIMQYVRMPVSEDGEIVYPQKGILQGMPLAPLLCNIYLHKADCFMEKQGIPFVRYGDDIVLFGDDPQKTEKWRDMVCEFYETENKLSCNQDKCRIDSPARLKFLGHRFESDRRGIIAESGSDESRITYRTWRSGDVTDPHRRVDILSDGILRQRDYDLLFETEAAETDIPPMTTEVINIHSNVIFDDGFLQYAMKNGIIINVFDAQYNKIGTFMPDRPLRSPSLLHKQLLAYYDADHRLRLAKEFVLAYLHNICLNLRYHNKETPQKEYRDVLTSLEKLKGKIKDHCDSYETLLMLEAQAHKEYYSCFDLIIKEENFVFEQRTKRPPKNEVNALMSFGNTVLYNLLATEIQKTSLDIELPQIVQTVQKAPG